jgi:hypothetical protein
VEEKMDIKINIKWVGRWESLGKPPETELGMPFVQHNQDGRLEVFATGQGAIFNIAQIFPNAGWRETWGNKGSPSSNVQIRAHVVGRNADGRQEIFAIGENALWQKWQVAPNNGWSDWRTLGTPAADVSLTDRFTVGRNQDGRQEVFAVGSDGNVWQIFQTVPNGGWSDWKKLGKPPAEIRTSDRITVGSNADGRQELFAVGKDAAIWHVWQVAPNVGWSDWKSLGTPRDQFGFPPQSPEPPKDRDLSDPVVQRNADGHLEVFAPGNGAFCNRWQERPILPGSPWRKEGWNAKPKPSDVVGIIWLDAALNVEPHLETLAVGDDGALWNARQVNDPPFWSKWESLGMPEAKIQQGGRLTIGTNQDGRLEVFVVGQDGAIWHTWQVR